MLVCTPVKVGLYLLGINMPRLEIAVQNASGQQPAQCICSLKEQLWLEVRPIPQHSVQCLSRVLKDQKMLPICLS